MKFIKILLRCDCKKTHFYHFSHRVFHFNILYRRFRIMSRPASPYLQQSKASPRPSSSKRFKNWPSAQNLNFFFSRASKAATIKAFRSTTPSLDAMRNVKKSQQFSSTKTKPTRIRPGALPDPETLYDELEASRKEIAAQKQLINSQVN